MDNRKDRGVGTDAEREGNERGGGEAGGPPEHADPIANVLPERVQERQTALIAPCVGDLRAAAERDGCAPAGLRGIEPVGPMAPLELIAVKRELVVQISIARPVPQRAPDPRRELPPRHHWSPPPAVPPSSRAMMPAIRCQSSASRSS